MASIRPLLLLSALLTIMLQPAYADQGTKSAAATYFKWYPGSGETLSHVTPEKTFQLKQGNYTITGPPTLRPQGDQLLRFLIAGEQHLTDQFRLQPGQRQFIISLMSAQSFQGVDQQLSVYSKRSNQMVFPFPVYGEASLASAPNRFALFSLLHTLIRADLAFGSQERLPISSHAFRFIDGLSGFLALEIMTHAAPGDYDNYLKILSSVHKREETSRRFSSAQLLAQNSNSENTDILAGLNQFFSGIGLTRNSRGAINPTDSSSAADRIRLFQWIQANKGPETIRDIIDYLSRSTGIWMIEESTEDSFCKEYIQFGCREKTIDGTRSDIILQYTTGLNFAQLLRRSKTDAGPADDIVVPHYPMYGFDYPKAGGANENVVGLHFKHDSVTVDAGDILDRETISMNGASLELAIRDEAYLAQIQIDFTTGSKSQDEQLVINSTRQKVPQTIRSTELLIGSRIEKSGFHSGWQDEFGVYFHWKRLQVEWNTKGVIGKMSDREYINSGFFLLDVQNTKAVTLSRYIALGLNYDFQLGLVNQSGSVRVIRSEKYNSDNSNLVLGANLGPELRINLPALQLEMKLGGAVDYLWQPLDDKGGTSGGDNSINASQSRQHLYATIGILF